MNPPYVDLYYVICHYSFFRRATVRKRFHKPEMVTLKALHPQAKQSTVILSVLSLQESFNAALSTQHRSLLFPAHSCLGT
jgi:hypothetical protein